MDEEQICFERKLAEEVSRLTEAQIPQFLETRTNEDILVCSGLIVKRFLKLSPLQLTLIDKIFDRFNRQLANLDSARCSQEKLKQQIKILSEREQNKEATIRQLNQQMTNLMQKILRKNEINHLLNINNHQLSLEVEALHQKNQYLQASLQEYQWIDNDSFIHINFSSQGSDSQRSQHSPHFSIQRVVHLMFDPNNAPAEQQPEEQKSLNSSLCMRYEDIWDESTGSYEEDLRIRSTQAPAEEVDRLGLVDEQVLNNYPHPNQQQPPDNKDSSEDRN